MTISLSDRLFPRSLRLLGQLFSFSTQKPLATYHPPPPPRGLVDFSRSPRLGCPHPISQTRSRGLWTLGRRGWGSAGGGSAVSWQGPPDPSLRPRTGACWPMSTGEVDALERGSGLGSPISAQGQQVL